jgi:coenzyme F420-reducing hydrogenase delta subunit/DNA-binding transcriptional ArsR family regulator
MKLIRVMCSGRVDMTFVLRAFLKGADGVFIGACHLGECNYNTHGNYQALSMVHIFRKLMKYIGINPERLRIGFMSGSEATLFVVKVNDFTKSIKKLGPVCKGEGIDENGLKLKLEAVEKLIPYIRLVERERLRAPFKSEEEIDKFFTGDEVNRLFEESFAGRLAISQIRSLLRQRPLPPGEISRILGLSPSEVSRHLKSSSMHGLVRYDEGQKCYLAC